MTHNREMFQILLEGGKTLEGVIAFRASNKVRLAGYQLSFVA